MTPCHFFLASGDVVFSYATSARPPTVFVGASILDCIRIVSAGDTVATIDFLVESDVRDGDTVDLLEPLLDFG
jgi:hypothetical protein